MVCYKIFMSYLERYGWRKACQGSGMKVVMLNRQGQERVEELPSNYFVKYNWKVVFLGC